MAEATLDNSLVKTAHDSMVDALIYGKSSRLLDLKTTPMPRYGKSLLNHSLFSNFTEKMGTETFSFRRPNLFVVDDVAASEEVQKATTKPITNIPPKPTFAADEAFRNLSPHQQRMYEKYIGVKLPSKILYVSRSGKPYYNDERILMKYMWKKGFTLGDLAYLHGRSVNAIVIQLSDMQLINEKQKISQDPSATWDGLLDIPF
jgi:hypothetical protein